MTSEIRNILYVEPSIYTNEVGGSFISLFHFTKALNKKRYRPVVLFFRKHNYVNHYVNAGIEVIIDDTYYNNSKIHSLFSARVIGLDLKIIKKLLKVSGVAQIEKLIMRELHSVRVIRSLIKAKNISLVHTNQGLNHDWAGIIASKLEDVPCISHERRLDEIRPMSRFLSRFVECSIGISKAVEAHLKKQKIYSRRITKIYNGVDIKLILNENTKGHIHDTLNLKSTDFVVGMFGNIIQWKGQEVFLKALAILKDKIFGLKAIIVGGVADIDYWYFDRLQLIIRENELEGLVQFTGFRKDVYSLMRRCQIAVHASLKPEPFGRVIVEAQAAGCTVIASDGGGASEIIYDGENGYLIPYGDYHGIAEKISDLYWDKVRLEKIRAAGRKSVFRLFDIIKTAAQTQALYDEILGR